MRARRRDSVSRWKWLLTAGVCLLTGLILGGCEGGRDHLALGTLERDLIRLSAPSGEIITQVFVQEGDQIEIGTPLLQLDDRAAQAEVARIAAELDRAQSYLLQLRNGAREEEVASAHARVASAEASAAAEEKNYQRTSQLVSQNLLGQAELDQALARRDSTAAALKDSREQLRLLQRGTRQESIEQARAQVDASTQALVIAKKHAADLTLTATRSGRIDSLPWKLGERVTVGAVLVIMLADDQPYVRAYAPETARTQLRIGAQLPVNIDGVDHTLTGTLIHLQQEPAFSPHYALTETERSRLMYLIKVQLGADAADLPSGTPAQVQLAESTDDTP